MFECDVTIPGLGHYIVGASVTLIGNEVCEVDVLSVHKYSEEDESYLEHDPDEFEIEQLERHVSISYFKQIH
jgi:hypothetical protein